MPEHEIDISSMPGRKKEIDISGMPGRVKKKVPTEPSGTEQPSGVLKLDSEAPSTVGVEPDKPYDYVWSDQKEKLIAPETELQKFKRERGDFLPKNTIQGIPLSNPEKIEKEDDFEFWDYVGRKLSVGVDKMAASILRTPETIYDVAAAGFNKLLEAQDFITGTKATKIPTSEDLGKMWGLENIPAKQLEAYAEFRSEIDAKYQKPIVESIKSGNYRDAAISIAGSIAESLPFTLAILMPSAAGVSAGKMVAGVTTTMTAQRKQELLDRDDLTEGQKTINSIIYGFAESIDVLFGAGTVGRAIKNIVKKEGVKGAKKFGMEMVDNLIQKAPWLQPFGEAFQEMTTQYMQNAADILILGEDKSYTDGLGDAGVIGFVMGSGGTAIIQGVKTVKKLATKEKPELTKEDIETIENIAKDPSYHEAINKEIDTMTEEGMLTPEDGEVHKEALVKEIETIGKIPAEFDAEKKSVARSLIKEKEQIDIETEKLDEAFKGKNEERKKEIDEELKALQPEKEVKEEPKEAEKEREKLDHQIAESEENTTLDNMTKGGELIPEDFYTNPEFYGDMKSQTYKESFEVIQKVKGNPEAEVTIYRSVPEGVKSIEKGDWVTLSKQYAKEHGLHPDDPSKDMPVIEMKVKVKDVMWDGNDMNEFAYFPKEKVTEKTTLEKYTAATDEKYGYIQEPGKEKRDLTKEEFEAQEKGETKEPAPQKQAEPSPTEYKEHITTGKKEQQGKYHIEKTEEGVQILNVETGKYVSQTKQNQWAVDQYIDANIEALRSGKKAEISEGVKEEDVNRIVSEESKNPEEIASAWLDSKQGREATFEEAVYEAATDIDVADLKKYTGDKTPDHLKGRMKTDGNTLETISERVNEILNLGEETTSAIAEGAKTKEGETIERIIDVIMDGNFKDFKPGKESEIEIALSERFKEITGLDLSESTAKKVTDYRDKMDKMADQVKKFREGLGLPEEGAPFFIAPHILSHALKLVETSLRAGASLNRALKLAVIKTKEWLKKGEEFDEKEFRKFFKKEIGDVTIETLPEPEAILQKYQEFRERLLKISPEYKAGVKQTKKATDQMQGEIIKFVKDNISELRKISGVSMPSLMKRIANVRAGKPKALENTLAYIEKIASGQAKKDRTTAVDDIREGLEGELKKSTKKEDQRVKAGRYSQEGIDAINEIKKSFELTNEQAAEKAAELEGKIVAEEFKKAQELSDTQREAIDETIMRLQKQGEYVSLYADLSNKSKEELDHVSRQLKEEYANLREDLKEKRKEKADKWKAEKQNFIDGLEKPTEAELVEEPKKPGMVSGYLAMQLNPGNLLTQLFGAKGESATRKLEKGAERKVTIEAEMKREVKEKVVEIFGSELRLRKALNKKTKIRLVHETKDKDGNVIQTETTPRNVKHGTLVHLWASYMSESNNGYTQRIADPKPDRQLKLSPEEWLRIDALLPKNLKDFTQWVTNDFLPSRHKAASEVYYKKNFLNLPKLPDYLFVNAKKVQDVEASLTDLYKLSTYKPFTTQRTYGEYDLWNNNIYEGLMNHIDQYSKFVGLSESIGEVNSLLNSKDVRRLIEHTGKQSYKNSLEHMMTIGMAGDKSRGIDQLFYNFIGSKILMNPSLFAKQVVSIITVFDPKYASPVEVAKSFGIIATSRKAKKRAKDLLRTHGGFSTRNIREIETLIKEGEPGKVQLYIDDIANKLGDKKVAMATKAVAEFLWNPTQKGDRFTVQFGGIRLIDAVYRTEMKRLKKEGVKEAEALASEEALYQFGAWMNNTQQAMYWTGKSQFQTGDLRYLAPFMNAPMSYARKVMTSYRDMYRDTKNERRRLIDKGVNPHVATVRSLKGVKTADLQRLLLYQVTLPILWTAVTTAGRSVVNLWSEDDEVRKQAWMDLGWDATLGWTKGLYVIGFLADFAYGTATGRRYGRTADNLLRTFDDSMELMEAIINVSKGVIKLDAAETGKAYKKQEKRLIQAGIDVAQHSAAIMGLPSVLVERVGDVITDDYYDDATKKAMRIYGIREGSLKEWFPEEKGKKAKRPKGTKPAGYGRSTKPVGYGSSSKPTGYN